MDDKDEKTLLVETHALVKELHTTFHYLRRHRSVLFGTPILEFDEVCAVLHLSARQVRRPREREELVGFNIGRRRMYFQTEVNAYIAKLEQEAVVFAAENE